MADQQYRDPVDRSRIDLGEPYEVQFWTVEFGCTEQELRDAVEKHGDSAEAIREVLKKQPAANIMEWDV